MIACSPNSRISTPAAIQTSRSDMTGVFSFQFHAKKPPASLLPLLTAGTIPETLAGGIRAALGEGRISISHPAGPLPLSQDDPDSAFPVVFQCIRAIRLSGSPAADHEIGANPLFLNGSAICPIHTVLYKGNSSLSDLKCLILRGKRLYLYPGLP